MKKNIFLKLCVVLSLFFVTNVFSMKKFGKNLKKIKVLRKVLKIKDPNDQLEGDATNIEAVISSNDVENVDVPSEEIENQGGESSSEDKDLHTCASDDKQKEEEDDDEVEDIYDRELNFFIDRNSSHNASKQRQQKKDIKELGLNEELVEEYIPFEGSEFESKLADYIVSKKDQDGCVLFNEFLPAQEYGRVTVNDFLKEIKKLEGDARGSRCRDHVGGTFKWDGGGCTSFSIKPTVCSVCDYNKTVLKKFKRVKQYLRETYLDC